MIFDPVPYEKTERDPVGCFTAEMTANGWTNTKFDHTMQEHLLSDEVSEFIRFVESFFKDCCDWQKLERYMARHGMEMIDEDFVTTHTVCYHGRKMDYTVKANRNDVSFFPYRKFKH